MTLYYYHFHVESDHTFNLVHEFLRGESYGIEHFKGIIGPNYYNIRSLEVLPESVFKRWKAKLDEIGCKYTIYFREEEDFGMWEKWEESIF